MSRQLLPGRHHSLLLKQLIHSSQIGQQHGRAAQSQVKGSIAFYEKFFIEKSGLDWPTVRTAAVRFLPMLKASWPAYVEEMEGLADGAGVDFESILALNVRTEIAFGLASDGCTAFSWKTKDASFLAQNWDVSRTDILVTHDGLTVNSVEVRANAKHHLHTYRSTLHSKHTYDD